jgi:AcrR family transcriptional regulator
MADYKSSGRTAQRTAAILAATLDLLAEVGYDQLTMDAVAKRAGASKMTIYRHWNEKRDLVIAALRARATEHPDLPANAEDLRSDLIALVQLVGSIVKAESVTAFASLLVAAHRDPVIAEAMHIDALKRRRGDCRDVIQRAIGRGELSDPRLDVVLFELLMGRFMFARLLFEDVCFPADPEGYVDAVLLPVLTHRHSRR